MPLTVGSRLGPYEVVAPLGAGGMGEVWRARDARLGRDVAIKALPDAFARDPDRIARFEREARLLASLTHTNIAAIHGLEEVEGHRYLVLEYVEGPTLAERLRGGALPVDEALDVCRQIALAVEAAHDSGIIHRDLKPGNVKLTPAGTVKVLDFGLAKGGAAPGSASDPNLSASPTMTYAATEAGVILGTAAYMSPEQARGRAVDRRTDIWSFGCVLYECLTGRPLYSGETVSDLIARILEREPDWRALPTATPPRVRELLRRCLEKDAKRRLRDIGEARLVLEEPLAPAGAGAAGAPATSTRRVLLPWLGWAVASLVALAALATLAPALLERAPAPMAKRFEIATPRGVFLPPEAVAVALSPDGRWLALMASDSTQTPSLWVRALDGHGLRRLEGTENAYAQFWSPDSRHLAFFAGGKLQRVPIDGGPVEVLCEARNGRGGTWNRDGVILFAPDGAGPLHRVSDQGGTPVAVSVIDSTRGETAHRSPSFLPDGRHYTFSSTPRGPEGMVVYVGRLDDPRWRRRLFVADGTALYADPGALVFARNGRLMAQRFDPRRLAVSGPVVPLGESPTLTTLTGAPYVTVSQRGQLALVAESQSLTQLVWYDAAGRRVGPTSVPPGRITEVALSPDGRSAALNVMENPNRSDLWIADLERGTMRRFTFGPGGQNETAVWSPDGRRLAFRSNRNGPNDLYVKSLSGGASEVCVHASRDAFKQPWAWSADGRTLFFDVLDAEHGWDLWQITLDGDSLAHPLLRTRFNERHPCLSPDGRWLAYTSDESGRDEVYVQSYPDGDVRHQVSIRGGSFPRWREDGRVIRFAGPDLLAVMTADVDARDGFHVGAPTQAFRLPPDVLMPTTTQDFARVLLLMPAGESAPLVVHLVEDWPALLAGGGASAAR